MGLLAGQDIIMTDGDVIIIKNKIFDKLCDAIRIYMHNNNFVYSHITVRRLISSLLANVRLYDLNDYGGFDLDANDIELLCNDDNSIAGMQDYYTIIVEHNLEIKYNLENALHFFRGEFDKIYVTVYNDILFKDTKKQARYTIPLSEYRCNSSLMPTIKKAYASSVITFTLQFIQDAEEYACQKLCKNYKKL